MVNMTTLGKYELHEQLGRGGFGTVYHAIDTTLEREVALKVLHPQLTTDPYFLEKFRNEAILVAALDSFNIVTIYDLSEMDGRVFIAMRYMAGGSLKRKLEKYGAISYEDTLRYFRQVCSGLQVAHKQGMVHRDVKPENILFDKQGNAVISDFGLAKAVQQSSVSMTSITGSVGTPAYRAQEIWTESQHPSPATDIYSLGCVLCEMLTGKVLFDASTPEGILTQHLINGAQIPRQFPNTVPSGIQDVIGKALAKDPRDRFQTTCEMVNSLDRLDTIQATRKIDIEPVYIIPAKREELIQKEKIRISEKDSMRMVYIPAGEFTMGSNEIHENEIPEHIVYLDGYWINETPVTNIMYAGFLNYSKIEKDIDLETLFNFKVNNRIIYRNNKWVAIERYAQHPVVWITWFGASAYSKWAGRQLPTEAQWEKAARGTDSRIFPWGNLIPDKRPVNFNFNIGNTSEVGIFPDGASPFGVLDMAGNVWEWVADWYDRKYYSSQKQWRNPVGPDENSSHRVLRGGSWNSNSDNIRSSYRLGSFPSTTYLSFGFRCALT